MNLTFYNYPSWRLKEIKAQIESKGFVLIPGNVYKDLLVEFGATHKDLDRIESGSIHAAVERDREASMSFRQIAFHRMILEEQKKLAPMNKSPPNHPSQWGSPENDALVQIDDFSPELITNNQPAVIQTSDQDVTQNSTIYPANCEAVTQISKDEISSDSGAKVYFERSATRTWNLPPFDYAESTIPMAIARLNEYFTPTHHHYQSNVSTNSNITINDQLLIRINKDADISEPTPEGIHQDGTEISSVTLIHKENVKAGNGGESRIWTLDQPTGNYDSVEFGKLLPSPTLDVSADFSWDNCLFDKALDSPWETILFNDRKVKHEVRSFLRDKGGKAPCYRDVIVNFVRKPLSDGSDKQMVDGVEESITHRCYNLMLDHK